MAKAKTVVPFMGTKEQEAKLMVIIEKYKEVQGALMPVLQQAQEVYGYLPQEVQIMIAEGLKLSLSEVYGVVTFYSQFALNPKGKFKVSVCLGTACYVRGAGEVFDKICQTLQLGNGGVTPDGKFSLDATRCLGACGLAPIITVNDDVYGRLVPDQIPEIIAKYN